MKINFLTFFNKKIITINQINITNNTWNIFPYNSIANIEGIIKLQR